MSLFRGLMQSLFFSNGGNDKCLMFYEKEFMDPR